MSNNIIDILMKRDNITFEEAVSTIESVREEISSATDNNDFELVETIMMSDLGLEMDYIFDVLF